MVDWKDIARQIALACQSDFSILNTTPISGGDINQCWQIDGQRQGDASAIRYFIKLNTADKAGMFAAEQAGLAAISGSRSLYAPQAIVHGVSESHSFLVLEYLDLATSGDHALLGQQLAAMHRCHARQFGWHLDNTIGTTPQHNPWSDNWIAFWKEQRLGFQLELAAHNGHRGALQTLGACLLDALPEFFADYQPVPSLLHGDLWSGNFAFLRDDTPVIFDPASYYGDREADIAMTELFGGFTADFYSAYRNAYPLHAGYAQRKTLYNLYHILNHANLFGGGYPQQAERMMQQLLAGLK